MLAQPGHGAAWGHGLARSGAAVGHQQQAPHDREVLQQRDPFLGVGHVVVEQQGGGHQEQQQQDRPEPRPDSR
jgi:hypothetical protein